MTNLETRPLDLAIQRASGLLRIKWADGHASAYSLAWLRSHCPCATCREERRVWCGGGGEWFLSSQCRSAPKRSGGRRRVSRRIRAAAGLGVMAMAPESIRSPRLRQASPCAIRNPAERLRLCQTETDVRGMDAPWQHSSRVPWSQE